ncbi:MULTISPECIES: hypothetical protein [unclassified Frigoribacterium]|uniref:hypothetical protein n=1 Tax=unclassified Frigoribacterium TaxID=2627005 RepID=UPI000FAF437E|nr:MULTISPECIES: hypothetical protein [unclassified Frigoribacterium]ROP73513.1 hypothetical protein EDF18_2877 [Frigoribacterium sp. PhB107]TDT63089.1 hypothetical protein EDF20_2390 [Frigoribacterium sp. PhB116]
MASTIARTQLGVVVLGIAAATLFGGTLPHRDAGESAAPQPQQQQSASDTTQATDAGSR